MANALKALLGDRIVGYHPLLAKVFGSIEAALFLSQMCYYLEKTTAEDGWVCVPRAKMQKDTGLNRHAQDRARSILTQVGVLKAERRGLPARMRYQVLVGNLAEQVKKYTDTAADQTKQRMPKRGHVYLLGNSVGLYKLGMGQNPKRRAAEMELASGLDVKVIGSRIYEDAAAAEQWYHQRFAERRRKGEWFALSDEEVTTIIDEWKGDKR